MCYRFLSISPTPVHALPASWMSYICVPPPYLRDEEDTHFAALGETWQVSSALLLIWRRPGVMSRQFVPIGHAQSEYPVSRRRFVWLRHGPVCIVFPIHQTPLSGGSRHSCWLAIDTFVVPQSSAATAVSSLRILSECLQDLGFVLSVTAKVAGAVDVRPSTQTCQLIGGHNRNCVKQRAEVCRALC